MLTILICLCLLTALFFPLQAHDWTDEVGDSGKVISLACCMTGGMLSLGYIPIYPKNKWAWIATGILLAIFVLRFLVVRQMPVFGENAGL